MEQSSSGQVRSLWDFGHRACRFNEVRRRRREKRWKVEKSKRIREMFCAGERAVIVWKKERGEASWKQNFWRKVWNKLERDRERKTGARGGKKKDCGPISPLSNKLLSIRRPATKHRAAKTHRNTHTHTRRAITLRGGAPRPFYWGMEGGGAGGRKTQLRSISPSLKDTRLFCFFSCFSQIKTEQEVRKTWIAFWFFLSCFHTRNRSLLHTYGLFLLFLIRQPNPTHVSRRAAPIPAFDNPSFSGSALPPLARLPALTFGPTNSWAGVSARGQTARSTRPTRGNRSGLMGASPNNPVLRYSLPCGRVPSRRQAGVDALSALEGGLRAAENHGYTINAADSRAQLAQGRTARAPSLIWLKIWLMTCLGELAGRCLHTQSASAAATTCRRCCHDLLWGSYELNLQDLKGAVLHKINEEICWDGSTSHQVHTVASTATRSH